jgi:hypothetical protein
MKVSVTGAVPASPDCAPKPVAGVACELPPPPPQATRNTAAVKKATAGRKTVNTGYLKREGTTERDRPRVLRETLDGLTMLVT